MSIHNILLLRYFFIFTVFAVLATPAEAGFIILNNPSQFSSSQTLITFDEGDFNGHILQPFEVVSSYRGVGVQSIGGLPNMPQAAFDPSPPREFGPGGNDGKTIINDVNFYSQNQGLQITLPSLVNQFGAEFLAVTPGDFTFTLFDGGQQVDLVTIAAGQIGQIYNFHAFQDDSAFDRVLIRGPGVNDGRVIMDNLRFAPEPNTVTLLGFGIVGLLWISWRRRPFPESSE